MRIVGPDPVHGFSSLGDALQSPVLSVSCALLLAAVFGWAGLTKLRHPFPAAVAAVHFKLARRPKKILGQLIGSVEILTAVGLIVYPARLTGALAAVISLAFFGLIAAALMRGERFPCGCLGDTEEEIGAHSLWRSGLMVTAAFEVLMFPAFGRQSLTTWAQAIVLACFTLAFPLLVQAWRRSDASAKALRGSLDWEWILQQSYPRLESRKSLGRRTRREQ